MPRKATKPQRKPTRDTIHTGDNLPIMQRYADGVFDLIYADPPFATNQTRTNAAKNQRYNDTWPTNGKRRDSQDGCPILSEGKGGGFCDFDFAPTHLRGYLAFLAPRLHQMHRLLAETGTFYLHLDWHAVHYVKVLADTIFGHDNFLNEIIWHYRTGGRSTRWFARKHDTILVYAKHRGKHTFHVQHDGRFRTDGLNYDTNNRPYKTTKRGRLYFNPAGPAMTDVWEIPFLSTVSKERTGWPTQKPLALLERIIKASTNPNDWTADFFAGSGTTAVAAKSLGRHYVACDVSPIAGRMIRQRIRYGISLR